MPISEFRDEAVLRTLGLGNYHLPPSSGCRGRLTIMHSGEADVIWADEQGREVQGRCRLARTLAVVPVAGDWVVVNGERVDEIFPRRNELRRTQTHGRKPQVLAANVDVVLIVVPLRSELHHRMIVGLTEMALESGARPVIVLSKADEREGAHDVAAFTADVRTLVGDVVIVTTSARSGEGVEALRQLLGEGVTAVLLGASGAGKTSLLNALENVTEKTSDLSRTGEGRHATTTRKLYRLSSGGVLLDIPGIRFSRAVADAATREDFGDLEELATQCRYRNCSHQRDQGCALQERVRSGHLDADRVERWRQTWA